jgi:predicted Zn finger-like uncharacterized protein
MYTDCPDCRRQFRVRAAQLSAARGQVRCGCCGRQFDALERLRDEPLPAVALPPAPAEAVTPPPAPPPSPAPAAPASVEPPEPPEPAFELVEEEEEEVAPSTGAAGRSILLPDLEEEEEPAPPRRARALWAVALVVLILAAAAQVAWFQRDYLLTKFPQLMPWAEKLCDRLACEVIRYRDLNSMRIVNRDVRLHPLYQNSLLVNATMQNGAGRVQPWPDVQLVLYDTTGKPVAYRRFPPNEYLDDSIDVRRGMRPGESTHFVLEVTGATEGAVSFEFGFL